MLKTLISSALLGAALIVTPIASAQTVTPSPTDHPKVDQACNTMTTRIGTHVAKYNDFHTQAVAKYQKTVQNVQNIITTLQGKGYDVSKLSADLSAQTLPDGQLGLNGQIQKFSTDNGNTVTAWTATQAQACGTSQGAFKDLAKPAVTAQKQVNTDVMNIRNFVFNTIVPDIQAVRAQKPTPTATP